MSMPRATAWFFRRTTSSNRYTGRMPIRCAVRKGMLIAARGAPPGDKAIPVLSRRRSGRETMNPLVGVRNG